MPPKSAKKGKKGSSFLPFFSSNKSHEGNVVEENGKDNKLKMEKPKEEETLFSRLNFWQVNIKTSVSISLNPEKVVI